MDIVERVKFRRESVQNVQFRYLMIVIAPCPGQPNAAPCQQCSCKMRKLGQGEANCLGTCTIKVNEAIDSHRCLTRTDSMRTQIDGDGILKQQHSREGGAQGPRPPSRAAVA